MKMCSFSCALEQEKSMSISNGRPEKVFGWNERSEDDQILIESIARNRQETSNIKKKNFYISREIDEAQNLSISERLLVSIQEKKPTEQSWVKCSEMFNENRSDFIKHG